MTATSDRPRKHALGLAAALVVWGIVLLRVVHAYGPETEINDLPYSSDTAIPVLMANDDRPFSPHNFYYYGADRFGAWAWVLPALIHRHTGLWWTAHGLFVLQASWVFLGAIVIGALCPRDRYAVPLIYLLVLCLQHDGRYILFELSQVYAWIVTSLLLTWLALRRLFRVEPPPARARWLARGGLLASLLLTLWSSVATTPYVAGLLGLEALRARLDETAGRRWWHVCLAWAVGLFATALLVEHYVRRLYGEHSLRHLQQAFRWQPSIDRGFLLQNLRTHLASLAAMSWFPLYVVALLALVSLIGWCLLRLARGQGARIASLRTVLGDDSALFAAGVVGIATLNFCLVVLVDHVRYNQYDTRYLAIAHQLAPVGSLVACYLVVERGLAHLRPRAGRALLAAGVVVLLLAMPERRPSPQFQDVKRVATDLARKAPGDVLMGGYWQTYVFTSLQPQGTMTPVPVNANRTAWTIDALAQAPEVVVEYVQTPLGGGDRPPASITQHGHTFRLVVPRFHVDGGYAFALYEKGDVEGDARFPFSDGFERGGTGGWSRDAGSSLPAPR